MHDVVSVYFAAWNESESDRCRTILEGCVTDTIEVIHPTWGRSRGLEALVQHIGGYQKAMPGTSVALASGLDSHDTLIRYAWKIVDGKGEVLMDGVDVVERAGDGRLERVLMFHGALPPA